MDFPPDIRQFVELRFRPEDIQAVYSVLYQEELRTPRVARAVLFLSNGSMSMLSHFADCACDDVREVLIQAEYETEVSDEMLWVRNMSVPFSDEENLGPDCFKKMDRKPPKAAGRAQPKAIRELGRLANRAFKLGEATYTVLPRQTHPGVVLCRRQVAQQSAVVQLPWSFVADQIAEHVAEQIEAIPIGGGWAH